MAKTAALRFSAKCPRCKVPLIEPEWSEAADRKTVNFWHCAVCGFTFETTNNHIIQSSRIDFIDNYFARRLAA